MSWIKDTSPMEDLYVHQLSPFLVHFTGIWGIRWYGLAYLSGFFVAWLSIRYMAQKGTVRMKPEEVGDFIMYMAIGVLAGGRIGYALFYGPHLFTDFSSQFPFWGVLEVHKGGMASHGGIAGVILVSLWVARKFNGPATHYLDLTTFSGALGIFFGRVANFINGELYGRVAPEGTSWAVKFPSEIYSWGYMEKPKLEGLATAVSKLGEVSLAAGQKMTITMDQWLSWVSSYDGVAQTNINHVKDLLVQATQSGNEAVIHAIGPALTGRYPSQLVQAGLEGLAVCLVLAVLWLRPWKPGFISAMFGVLYAVARIIGEQYRLPDAHIGYELFGLTRGQWLSVAMLVGAIGYMIYVMRSKEKPLGGWRQL